MNRPGQHIIWAENSMLKATKIIHHFSITYTKWLIILFHFESRVDIYFLGANDLREIISKINKNILFLSFPQWFFVKYKKGFDLIVKCFSRHVPWQLFLPNNPQSIILTNCLKCSKTVSLVQKSRPISLGNWWVICTDEFRLKIFDWWKDQIIELLKMTLSKRFLNRWNVKINDFVMEPLPSWLF